jgi:ketopantoate reductase
VVALVVLPYKKRKNSMPAKQTIAVIGAASAEGREVLAHLLPTGHRLLLMDEAAEKLPGLQQQLHRVQPRCETDIQPCCREACWEADVVVLAKAHPTLANTLQKIKEVATTKIVVCLGQNKEETTSEIAQHLPYSKIVFMQLTAGVVTPPVISGGNKSAVEAVRNLFKIANNNQ